MELTPLMIGDLTARLPIVQGGMGIGISLGRLAGTVAKEGGVGLISAAQIGYREPDFDQNTVTANLRAIHQEYQKARAIAPDGVIGFNIMVAMNHYDDYVKEVVKTGADLIVSGAGLPLNLPELVGDRPVKIAPIVSTAKSANVILRYWGKKHNRTADMVVIEGPKAGGHLGFTTEQLDQYDEPAYEAEIQAIRDIIAVYEEKYQVKIPVVLAGAISTSEDVRRAFALGMDGVQVASRFVTTEECDADIKYKESYIKARPEDIAIVKSPVGMPGRAIMNTFMERVMAGEKFTPAKCRSCLKECNPAEIPYCITERLMYAAQGKVDEGLLFCGGDAYRAKRMETVHEVIESLIK